MTRSSAMPSRSQQLAHILQQQAQAMARLPLDTHASWLKPLGLKPHHGQAGYAPHWATALQVDAMPIDALEDAACRLAWLPPLQAARALRLRALLHRRRALRAALPPAPPASVVSTDTQPHELTEPAAPATTSALARRGTEWVGAPAWQALLHDAPAALHDAPLPAGDIASLATALAWEGYCRLQAEDAWPTPGPARLLRLRFARTLVPVPPGPPEPALTHWLLARLPDLFSPDLEVAA